MHRRHFIAASGLAAAAPALLHASDPATPNGFTAQLSHRVNFNSDGLALTPHEYATLLQTITANQTLQPDNYSLGGEIARLEAMFAQRLGKQAAVFLPTGTLANHLAVRVLAGADHRVLVQADSHLYNDSGDAATLLSGLNLIPLAPGSATLLLDDVKRVVEASAGGRVPQRVGVISIENPVRRHAQDMVDLAELDRVCAYAREQGIRLHLDGARLFNLPLHSGRSVRAHAAAFDTVYVSLWKHFNGVAGAILAGDASVIDDLYHTRRMFGGSLPQAWPQIAPVAQYLETYEADYAQAWQAADALVDLLRARGFDARKSPRGTSRLWLKTPVQATDAATDAARMDEAWISRAAARGVVLPGARTETGEFALQVNTSILRQSPAAIANTLIESLAG